MKIAFLTGRYHPFFSAIGKCVYNLVGELEQDHDVLVISNADMKVTDLQVQFQKHRIVRVSTSLGHLKGYWSDRSKHNSLWGLPFIIAILTGLRLFGYLKFVFSRTSVDHNLVASYLKALKDAGPFDLLVPTCYPFEAVIAAQTYKQDVDSAAKIRPFLFDRFSTSPTLHRFPLNRKLKLKRHLLLEKRMLHDSEHVLAVDSWRTHAESYFEDQLSKISFVEHPLLVKMDDVGPDSSFDPNDIHIVYAGVLQQKIRPPGFMIDVMEELIKQNKRIKLHFYVLGNGVSEIKRFARRLGDSVFNHGFVDSAKALSVMRRADFLLSVGNLDDSLIPSKIFEYMSMGKPIIHIYYSRHDPLVERLVRYGRSVSIRHEDEAAVPAAAKISDFIEKQTGKDKPFSDVFALFYEASPEYVAKELLKEVQTRI